MFFGLGFFFLLLHQFAKVFSVKLVFAFIAQVALMKCLQIITDDVQRGNQRCQVLQLSGSTNSSGTLSHNIFLNWLNVKCFTKMTCSWKYIMIHSLFCCLIFKDGMGRVGNGRCFSHFAYEVSIQMLKHANDGKMFSSKIKLYLQIIFS